MITNDSKNGNGEAVARCQTLRNIGNGMWNHKGKIALGTIGVIALALITTGVLAVLSHNGTLPINLGDNLAGNTFKAIGDGLTTQLPAWAIPAAIVGGGTLIGGGFGAYKGYKAYKGREASQSSETKETQKATKAHDLGKETWGDWFARLLNRLPSFNCSQKKKSAPTEETLDNPETNQNTGSNTNIPVENGPKFETNPTGKEGQNPTGKEGQNPKVED